MNIAFVDKITAMVVEKNGTKIVDIYNMAVYFAPGDIDVGMFSSMFQNRTDLESAIQTLDQEGLVCLSDNSFSVPEPIRCKQREDLDRVGSQVMVLKMAISLLKTVDRRHFRHFVWVFEYATPFRELLEDLGDLPGTMLLGMIEAGEAAEALRRGKRWVHVLKIKLGDYHWTVLHLRSKIGLAMVKSGRRDEALTLLTDVYKRTCNALYEAEVDDVTSMLVEAAVGAGQTQKDVYEARLRRIVFGDKGVGHCRSNSDLLKWLRYARSIHSYGMTGEGISILDDILRCGGSVSDCKDATMLDVRQAKALFLTSQSRFPEAVELLRVVYRKSVRRFGIFSARSLQVGMDLGEAFMLQGETDDAMEEFEEVARHCRTAHGEKHPMFLTAKTRLVKVCMLAGDFEEAHRLSRDLHRKLTDFYGATHKECFSFRKDEAEILFRRAMLREAVEVYEELLEEYRNCGEYEDELGEVRAKVASIEKSMSAGRTLHSFAKEGDLEGVLSKIASGIEVDAKDPTGVTPLYYAVREGRVRVVRALIERGATLLEATPFRIATDVRDLLGDVDAFFEAVMAGDGDRVVDIASREPCVVGARNRDGDTPLGLAAGLGHAGVVRVLLEYGADPMLVSTAFKVTPLHRAAAEGHVEVAEVLLEGVGPEKASTLLDSTSFVGDTPLHSAAREGHLATARCLLSHGAIYCARRKRGAGETPWGVAHDNCKDLLSGLDRLFAEGVVDECAEMDAGVVMGARNAEGRTLLQVAVMDKRVQLVKKLVEMGKSLDVE